MSDTKYTPVIGLEVHVELSTESKMFCRCSAKYFGKEPNSHTCPVCLGLPGALPVPNKKAIDACIMIGRALHCEIPLASKFDRKNYFYPDLSKGYQISQYDEPFCENGYIVLSSGKKIRIRRVHMEEDTGKLLHDTVEGRKVSLIDFNRSGVPLVEIVTEPDFSDAADVKDYLQTLQKIVRFLGVASANMEKGEMRCEPNISLRESNTANAANNPINEYIREEDLPKYKVEVKNINSFSFAEKAIYYEIRRQTELLDKGETPTQETRGFVEAGAKTVSQRSKEEAHDYRYFPEPDIPPIIWTQKEIDSIASRMLPLPDKIIAEFESVYGIQPMAAKQLTRDTEFVQFAKKVLQAADGKIDLNTVAHWIINKRVDMTSDVDVLIAEIIAANTVSGINEDELSALLTEIIARNEKIVADYKGGKENAIMALVGQAMKELKGKAKADTVTKELRKLLLG